ncbi:MAG: diadenylate cyclase CdaA [Bacteroidales bacterium]|nr:diadenylate cyclase CdaA [Bacteroidales bacterium]
MLSTAIDFKNIHFVDVIDIVLVLFLLFQLYRAIKGTAAVNIFIGIISIYVVWQVVDYFKLKLLSNILGAFLGVGVLALIIVFQPEIRQFLLLIGKPKFFINGTKKNIFGAGIYNIIKGQDIVEIVNACKNMIHSKTGALIVIAEKSPLTTYIESGEVVETRISTRAIESIFFKNNPLHDGAIIISDGKITAAKCILPVTDNPAFPTEFGLRHKSAAGITEKSDAVAIVVSEQTGFISFLKEGKMEYNVSLFKLKQILRNEFKA